VNFICATAFNKTIAPFGARSMFDGSGTIEQNTSQEKTADEPRENIATGDNTSRILRPHTFNS
jgi:hypothetical protein